MILYALVASLGFDLLYAETVFAHTDSPFLAAAAGIGTFLAFGLSFLLPAYLFHYSHEEPAPRVLTQVILRATVGSLIILILNIALWLVIPDRGIPLLEELYMYALAAIVLFHGLDGAMASHVIYLQATHQYNSNQLVAVLAMLTLVLLVLVLYLLAFDLAVPREPYIHVRDLTLVTLVLIGYGRAIYRMAHH